MWDENTASATFLSEHYHFGTLRLPANLVVQVHISSSAPLCLARKRGLCYVAMDCREVCLFTGRHCEALVVVSVRCNLGQWRMHGEFNSKLTWLRGPCHLRLLEAHWAHVIPAHAKTGDEVHIRTQVNTPDPTRPAPQDEVVPCSGCNGECLLTGRCTSLPGIFRAKPRALCSSRPAWNIP